MGLEWLGRKGDAIAAFFATSQMALVIGSLLVTYLVMRVVLATLHRPWQSPYWTLYPLGVAMTAIAAILLLWPGQPRWALGLSCLVSVGGVAWLTFQVSERVRRAKQIVAAGADGPAFEAEPGSLDKEPAVAGAGRRIVIFCDGTSNKPDQMSEGEATPTNVYRLYRDLRKDESQTAWYDPGVGTQTSSQAVRGATVGRIAAMIGWLQGSQGAGLYVKFRTIIEAGFGVGITENIVQAYTEIARQYRPGDRIYLIGFSRGAYTARCVAGVIRRCGLLTAENMRYCPDVVRLYRTRKDSTKNVPIRPELIHKQLPTIEFLGLFDTVGSLGVPLWGWWFNWRLFFRNTPLSTDPSPICIHVYHAMAMDERRSQFFPTPFDKSPSSSRTWTRTLEQLWFRGGHCDVGGGYADHGLSDVALEWMYKACIAHGLVFKGKLLGELQPDPLARMHDELQLQPAWRLMGSWPRWHPVDADLHPSVTTRANAIHALARHDMRTVGSDPETFLVGAQREWDRTGLILEGGGARYLLEWKEGQWRDKDCPPCDPMGQPGRDFFRWLFRFRRRLPQLNYMTLCISIAHPRQWPLREGGLARLLRYAFWRDPVEMREQVAPVGGDFGKHKSVIIQNDGAAGVLYAFANDAWMTAGNNSGGLEMTIQRLGNDDARKVPVWTLSCALRHRKKPNDWVSADTEAWRWTHSQPT